MVGLTCVVQDVTERREAQETQTRVSAELAAAAALRDSEDSLRSIVEGFPDGAVVVVDGEIVLCNEAVTEIWGYEREQILGASPAQFVHPDDRARAAERIAALMAGRPAQGGEYRGVRADGELVTITVS